MSELTAVAPPATAGTPDRIPWPVFAVTVTGAFMVALDLSIVNVAFPSLSESFPDASPATLSWVLSAYSVVFGALLLGAGRIADRSGRRRWFQRGLAVFTIGSLLCGVAWEPWILIAGRVVQATGAALLMPTSLALLLAATPAAARAPAVAMWGGITALAVATGPSLGSVLIDAGGWRWAFFINLPVAAVAAVLARRSLRESAVGGPPPDVAGIAMITVAVAALALGITQGSEGWGWADPRTLTAFAIAAVLGPTTYRRARVHPSPAIDLRLFENRTVALANAATLFYGIGFFAMLLGNVLFLTGVWGYSTLAAGLAITPGPLVVAGLSRSTGRLAQRVGYRPVLIAGAAFFGAGQLLLITLVGTEPSYLAAWLVPSLLTAVGVALSFPVLSAAAVAGLPPERFAAGGALNQTARQIGAVLGVAALVAIVGTPASPEQALERFQWAWAMGVAASVASGLISAGQRRPAPAVPAPALDSAVILVPETDMTSRQNRVVAGGGSLVRS
jgi:EmrB/QacA subfamily drug resistance transporter